MLGMRTILEQITGKLPEEDWQILADIAQPRQYPKHHVLLAAGDVCDAVWYLETGAVRFFEWQEGEEQTTHFHIGPTFFSVYHSLITGNPSSLSLKLEQDSAFLVLPYSQLLEAYARSHALERMGRIMAEYQFIGEFNRRRMHLNLNASQRYGKLEQEHPQVFQHFQLKDIATFLGITPVSLSRLRKDRSRAR